MSGKAANRLLLVAIILATVWGALVLFYAARWSLGVRSVYLFVWLMSGTAALIECRARRAKRFTLVFGLALAGVIAFWMQMRPAQDQLWADDVERLVDTRTVGNRVTLENERNFEWRSDTDYISRWETREYDLDRLVSADLVMSYWMGPAIAHTLISFAFEDGQRIVFSLEVRKERGDSFSAVGGFFREFEETLVAADERDILRVRTNVRGEDMYLYRLDVPPAELRDIFRAYLRKASALRETPRFYNSATSNCTTVVVAMAREVDARLPADYRILLSGYFAGYVQDQNGLVPGYDLPTLTRLGRVTDRARAADRRADFSEAIRVGIPGEDRSVIP